LFRRDGHFADMMDEGRGTATGGTAGAGATGYSRSRPEGAAKVPPSADAQPSRPPDPSAAGQPHVKHLEGKLWAMRLNGGDGIARALYVTAIGSVWWWFGPL
jgi:hypothetical protein